VPHSEIDKLILHIGTVVAHEFATKPVQVALETTRMMRKQLTEAEEYKLEYEARIRELNPFDNRQFVGFAKLKEPGAFRRIEKALADDLLDPEATSEEDVDEELRKVGVDPEEVRREGVEFVQKLAKEKKEEEDWLRRWQELSPWYQQQCLELVREKVPGKDGVGILIKLGEYLAKPTKAKPVRCPHDGGKCHHNCISELECFRMAGGMRLTKPHPGYPKCICPDDGHETGILLHTACPYASHARDAKREAEQADKEDGGQEGS
jgi:hypothetical protein